MIFNLPDPVLFWPDADKKVRFPTPKFFEYSQVYVEGLIRSRWKNVQILATAKITRQAIISDTGQKPQNINFIIISM